MDHGKLPPIFMEIDDHRKYGITFLFRCYFTINCMSYNELYNDELHDLMLYKELSNIYSDVAIKEKLSSLSAIEGSHMRYWMKIMEKRGQKPKNTVKGWRIKLFAFLSRIMGVGFIMQVFEAAEQAAVGKYIGFLVDSDLTDDEKEQLRGIIGDELEHESFFAEQKVSRFNVIENIRDILFGMNDGLVEVLAAVSGFAGIYPLPALVALAGFVVGIAGTLSMAAGAYVSSKSERGVKEGQLTRLKLETEALTKQKEEELIAIMKERGLEVDRKTLSRSKDIKRTLFSILSRERVGVSPEELKSPSSSAIYTGIFYFIGAVIPIIPYVLPLPILLSQLLSVTFTAVVLALAGYITGMFSGLNPRRRALEMVLIGLGAAAGTFLLGKGINLAVHITVP